MVRRGRGREAAEGDRTDTEEWDIEKEEGEGGGVSVG